MGDFTLNSSQISRHLIIRIVSLGSWLSVRNHIFAVLPDLFAVLSLITRNHNGISISINRRFTGLSSSILKESSTFSILGGVSLCDPSKITISDTNMNVM